MSVLIKGIEMPIAGQTIEICESDAGKHYARLTPSFDDWHEIVYVPPHGDLMMIKNEKCNFMKELDIVREKEIDVINKVGDEFCKLAKNTTTMLMKLLNV